MSDTAVVVGDWDVSRADTMLRVAGTQVFDDTDASGDEGQVATGSFGVDVDLLGIDWKLEFDLQATHDPGASIANNLNTAGAAVNLTTLGEFARASEDGVYWDDIQELHETQIFEDETNQAGGGGEGRSIATPRYLIAVPSGVAQVDTSPDAGQAIQAHARIITPPGAGNYRVGAEAILYGRQR